MKELCLLVTIATLLTLGLLYCPSMCHLKRITFSRDQFIAVAPNATHLPHQTYKQLTLHGINKYLATKRGTRAGCQKQRHIKVIVSPRDDHTSASSQLAAYPRTLTPVQCVNLPPDVPSIQTDMCLINSRSVRNKVHIVKDYIVDNDIDFTAITETWLKPGSQDSATIKDLCPTTYKLTHQPRISGRGGGTGALHKSSLSVKLQDTPKYISFEHSELLLKASQSKWFRIIIIYRPPPSKEYKFTVDMFLQEFSTLLERVVTAPCELIIMGDFNFHVEDPNDHTACQFTNLLSGFALEQLITHPTHKDGHTLDLVITRIGDCTVTDIQVTNPVISDHSAIHFKLSVEKPATQQKTILYRNWKKVDIDQFSSDLTSTFLQTSSPDTVTDLVHLYNTTLTVLTNKHAPLKKKTVKIKLSAQWYNGTIDKEKKKRRYFEKRYRTTYSPEDYAQYEAQCHVVNNLLETSKQNFYREKINEHSGNQKELFKVLNKLLNRKCEPQYPAHDSTEELANRFVEYFTSKITNIRNDIEQFQKQSLQTTDDIETDAVFKEFEPVGEHEVEKLVFQSATKSCSLDPIPTWILKKCLGSLLPVITQIINLSLSTSVMPDELKHAILNPLLKKTLLDPEILKHFRPVSNLAYISKLIEKCVAVQLTGHCQENKLYEELQSSYKAFHSTETALLKVHNDLLQCVDNNKAAVLVLLDLSAAFDTVDHQVLLNRLKSRLGITGCALQWFTSYLQGRKQRVHILDATSKERDLAFGVPQGSVLGPLLFSIYTLPLGEIIRKHKSDFHLYADDSQMYVTFSPTNASEVNTSMEHLIHDVRSWYTQNFLKLNDEKTEVLIISSRHKLPVQLPPLQIGNERIQPTSMARNLGVVFDNSLKLDKQINQVVQQSFHSLRNMHKIRACLPDDAAKTMVHTLISSKLDYCNSLYFGLPQTQMSKLQYVQNAAARLITHTHKYDHITPILEELHWLPIKYRIMFKILLLTYKSLNGLAPSYLCKLLVKKPNRGLRSDCGNLLVIPKTKLVSYGDRSFSYAAPRLWNSLPVHIRHSQNLSTFKTSLKTHLFRLAYN